MFSYTSNIIFFSSGKPSEKNLYSDIESAWTALRTQYGVSPENILLYGQSIGTVPTVDLASRYEVAAVVLHSALMSGMRVAFPQTKRTWFFDAFPRYVEMTLCNEQFLTEYYATILCFTFLHQYMFSLFSIDKVPKISSPVLVIHGTEDEVIDFSHGLAIYEKCPRAVDPLWVEVR